MSTPLFVRSVYTLLSSMCTIPAIVRTAKENGYSSVALVDRYVLAGSMSFKKECEKEGIKPIYGLEFDMKCDDRIFSAMLLSKNDEGYRNLMGLSSFICTTDKKPIDVATLNHFRKENIFILFSDDMPLTYCVDKKLNEEEALNRQKDFFDDYIVALCDHDVAINKKRDEYLKRLLKTRDIATFALSRTFYINKEDAEEYEVLKCIRDKKTLSDKDNSLDYGRHFLSKDEFHSLYDEDDIAMSDVIASMCDVKMDYKTALPLYPTKEGINSRDYLVGLCKEGLKRRFKNQTVPKEYIDRLKNELETIINMHFEDYFLIVYDFILFAKKNQIMVGPGRGSAAGSLVSYCLGITDIDPLKYGLIFERFLNPERVTMPDIDTDFPDDRRDEVITYVKNKYGENHVAHIITYGTLKAKQVLRDVGRVLGYSTGELDAISKCVPSALDTTLKKAYESAPLFRQRIESDERYRRLYRISLKLEGFPRHESTHAAGIVMSRLPLSEVAPLIAIEDDAFSTQYTMEHLEELGLIKMDFLGLRNLGIIAEIVDDINKDTPFRISSIPLNDPKTLDLICRVNTLGVFQLESSGMQSLIRKFRPKSFEEIGMTIALFRPGPMENIPLFIENKEHPENIQYLHKDLIPILKETYGIIVYQEQIMSIARKMASFSYGKADIMRRAMSKKKLSELEKLQSDFVEGCVKNGYERQLGERVYDLVLKFANYGFNKSHSIAYALIAYQMAYLKANYPLYFYKALLNGTIGSDTKTHEYITECLNIKQKVRCISINDSLTEYRIKDDAIIMPFGVCKDVGNIGASKIIAEREKGGEYKDYVDTVRRLVNASVEKNVIENLIYSGAFDELGESRYTMITALPNVLKYANAHKGDISLMDDLDDTPVYEKLKDDRMVSAENEKSVLGFYFSFNPIMFVKQKHNINTEPLYNLSLNKGYIKGFGMIRRVKQIKTKKGEQMAFVDLSDDSGSLSLAVMPNIYRQNGSALIKGRYVYFEGNSEKENSCLVRRLEIY